MWGFVQGYAATGGVPVAGHLLDSMGGIRESIESHGHVARIFNPGRGPHSGFYSKAPLGDHCPGGKLGMVGGFLREKRAVGACALRADSP